MKEELTTAQQEYYDAIVSHIYEYHSFPSRYDLAHALGVSNNAVQEMLRGLENLGYLDDIGGGKFRLANVELEIWDVCEV